MSDLISSIKRGYTSSVGSIKNKAKKSDSETVSSTSKEDTFIKSSDISSISNVTYNKASFLSSVSNVTADTVSNDEVTGVDALLLEQEERKQSLMEMVMEQITKQAGNSTSLTSTLEQILGIDEKLKADLTLDELETDDTWGVEAVADRIMSMAESFVGTDSSLFATIKQAVLDGFADAESKWGGELPEVCQKTMAEINNRFDDWEKELFGEE